MGELLLLRVYAPVGCFFSETSTYNGTQSLLAEKTADLFSMVGSCKPANVEGCLRSRIANATTVIGVDIENDNELGIGMDNDIDVIVDVDRYRYGYRYRYRYI